MSHVTVINNLTILLILTFVQDLLNLSGLLTSNECKLNLCNLDHHHLVDDRMFQAAIPSPTIALE